MKILKHFLFISLLASQALFAQTTKTTEEHDVGKIQIIGSNDLAWDGRNQAGVSVPSGVYFFRMQAGSFSQTRKMLLVK